MHFNDEPWVLALEKSHLKDEKHIEGKLWQCGDMVICRKQKETIAAFIVGFYENSAVVLNAKTNERTNVSFRNMFDPVTERALKTTTKYTALTDGGVWGTAYIPSDEDRIAWKKQISAWDNQFK